MGAKSQRDPSLSEPQIPSLLVATESGQGNGSVAFRLWLLWRNVPHQHSLSTNYTDSPDSKAVIGRSKEPGTSNQLSFHRAQPS